MKKGFHNESLFFDKINLLFRFFAQAFEIMFAKTFKVFGGEVENAAPGFQDFRMPGIFDARRQIL